MTTPAPYQQPTATPAGQPTVDDNARKFLADLESVYAIQQATTPTFYRDDTKPPAIGSTPPVPQPGRPPMSQRAVDLNTTILTSSVLTAVLGGSATAVLWASGHADPTVVGMIVAAPAALAIPIVALSRLVKRAKEVVEAAPPVINNNYTGTVIQDQRSTHTQTRGVWAKTTNQLPR